MWELLFDWPELVSRGFDVVTYMVLAGAGTLLFLIRLALALFGVGAGDGDDLGGHGADSDTAFGMFSLLSVLAFFMGAGWMGLAARLDWDMGSIASALLAFGFGTVLMVFASGAMYLARRLNAEARIDMNTAVGTTGRVYMPIPPRGEGEGRVEVTVSGRRRILNATSTGAAIEAFTLVRVVEAHDDHSVVVERRQ